MAPNPENDEKKENEMLQGSLTDVNEVTENEDVGKKAFKVQLQAPVTSDEDEYDTDLEMEDTSVNKYRSMTAKDTYVKYCEQLGVVPASYFLAHMNDEVLNMSHHSLGPNGAKAIAAPLVVNTSILELNIEDNWITSEGMQDIAEMLMENCYICYLNISCNKLGTEGARFVCEVLQENTSLKELNVSRNDFKDSDAQYFAEALKQNFRLKELNLSGNAFCEVGGEWLGQAIASNEAIKRLNLSWNHLRRKGALAICAGMKLNITIKSLDLSWNGFADEGAMAMGEALKTNNSLTWLDLSNNRITGKGAFMLAKGLEINDTLKTLKLGENPIGGDGALILLRSIAKNEKSALEDLDLRGIQISKEFKDLAEELKQRAMAAKGSSTSFSFTTNRRETSGEGFTRRGSPQDDPMMLLQNFLQEKRLRLVDLFKSFDKDTSWKISPQEFQRGIQNAGIPFTKKQLKNLVSSLDVDVDGQVDYKELLKGRKEALLRQREEKRKLAKTKARKKEEAEKLKSAWKQAVLATSSATNSPNVSPNLTPLRSRSMVISVEQEKPKFDVTEVAGALLRVHSVETGERRSPTGLASTKVKFLGVEETKTIRSKSALGFASTDTSYSNQNKSSNDHMVDSEISIPIPVRSSNNYFPSKTVIKTPKQTTAGIPNSRKVI
ncbi:unnamed protein product [Clavelina lepadiformis]|uniref:EF-hand domain-containing protein n=1 Tax=Clavelina lepadiformis TaxID=159417 RepID=A0ABP0G457_CLALP